MSSTFKKKLPSLVSVSRYFQSSTENSNMVHPHYPMALQGVIVVFIQEKISWSLDSSKQISSSINRKRKIESLAISLGIEVPQLLGQSIGNLLHRPI